jgi:hypothetical protein
MDPQTARDAYKELGARASGLLHAAEDARRRLAEAERGRTAAYASVEAGLAHLDGLEQRAAGIWRELTTRFGPHATGPLPEPADRIARGPEAEVLLDNARLRVREPVDHPLAGRYVRMAVLGFGAALVLAIIGLELTLALRHAGPARLVAVGVPVLAAPWLGRLAALGWIRFRTSHEEREYALDTAVAGAFGGSGVWLIAVTFIVIRVVT